MQNEETVLEVNGIKYTVKNSVKISKEINLKEQKELRFVIVRTFSAGVHMGYLKSRFGKEVELTNTQRIWSWAGAASLSQLALEGSKKPADCKLSVVIPSIELMEAIEIIPVSKEAEANLKSIKVWKQ